MMTMMIGMTIIIVITIDENYEDDKYDYKTKQNLIRMIIRMTRMTIIIIRIENHDNYYQYEMRITN